MIEIAVVGIEFLVVEVEAGEKLVFFENIVGNDGLIGAWAKIKRAQLLEAPDQESKLRLKGGSGFTVVESLEKRIVLGFDDALGCQPLAQDLRQSTLADANRTFHCNVTGQFEKLGHGRDRKSVV